MESVLVEQDTLARLQNLDLPGGLVDGVSAKVVRTWRDRAAADAPSTLGAHPERIRVTRLARCAGPARVCQIVRVSGVA